MPWKVKNEMPTGSSDLDERQLVSAARADAASWFADPTRKSRYLKMPSSARCSATPALSMTRRGGAVAAAADQQPGDDS